MKISLIQLILVFYCGIFYSGIIYGQEYDLSGIEISIDQDNFADFLREDGYLGDRNYAVSLRLGIYGQYANSIYLGLPWVREKIDGFLIDKILFNKGFSQDKISHNFALTINGFSPSHISDEVDRFQEAIDLGYQLQNDRPFSSFTGFRSTRRLEGFKRFVHSARRFDMSINTSFVFGFTSLGLVKGVENLFGGNRPNGNLWSVDDTKPYPTGQIMTAPLPIILYSISTELVVAKPLRKVLLQIRPELNLGSYTNIGFGIDFGKVMNVEPLIDNLSYTDINNPSLIVVNNENLGFSIVGGVTGRVIIYNQHMTGFFNDKKKDYNSTSSLNRFQLEGYVGVKLQFAKKVELTFAINNRSAEFSTLERKRVMWGTLGLKYLFAEEGEGCYD